MGYRRTAPFIIGFGALAIAAVSLHTLRNPCAAVSCLLGWTLLAIATSDAFHYIIPDALSLPLIPSGLLASYFQFGVGNDPWLAVEHTGAALLGAALLYGVREMYFYCRRREGLGLGDVKLAAAAGAWTGLQGVSNVLLLGCTLALISVAATMCWQKRLLPGTTAMPFGIFLAPAIWMVWYADALTNAI